MPQQQNTANLSDIAYAGSVPPNVASTLPRVLPAAPQEGTASLSDIASTLPRVLPAAPELPSVLPAAPEGTGTPGTPSLSDIVSADPVTSEASRLGGPLGAAAVGALKGADAAISAPPQAPAWQKAVKAVEIGAAIPTAPIDLVSHALGSLTDSLSNYTPEGRAEHPILSKVGDALNAARELLTGGQSAGKPMGTRSAVLNNPVTVALSAAPGAADAASIAQDRLLQAVRGVREARAAKAAAQVAKVAEATPEMFEPRPEPPTPMHGKPLEVESPLDSATISKEGGKRLAPEAVEALQHRQGTVIPVGSTTRNVLMRDVQPNAQVIEALATKMNQLVQDAPPLEDSVWDTGDVQQNLADLKASIPASERAKGVENVNDEIENNADALHSNNLQELLEARRQLGRRIDWENLTNIPETPKETVNSARAIIYRALGDKVHEAVPETVAVDAQLQPNIELRSYYRNRLGDRAVDDPVGATAEAESEFQKGKRVLDTKKYNEQVAKNREIAGLDQAPAPTTGPVGEKLDSAVAKFKNLNLNQFEQDSVRKMLTPSVKTGRVFGANTSWVDGLRAFDKLTPEQQAARFSDPSAIRSVLRRQATKQLGAALAKYGSLAALAHVLGIDRTVLHAILGE